MRRASGMALRNWGRRKPGRKSPAHILDRALAPGLLETDVAERLGRRFPEGAAAALVFAHDSWMVIAAHADRVFPLFQLHFRAALDPSTLKR